MAKARRKNKRWIQGAVKRPGALRNRAKRAGAITKNGTISMTWLRQQAKRNDRTGKQARLALTLRKLNRK